MRNRQVIWNDKHIRLGYNSLVTSIVIYACETWTLTAELETRITPFEIIGGLLPIKT